MKALSQNIGVDLRKIEMKLISIKQNVEAALTAIRQSKSIAVKTAPPSEISWTLKT